MKMFVPELRWQGNFMALDAAAKYRQEGHGTPILWPPSRAAYHQLERLQKMEDFLAAQDRTLEPDDQHQHPRAEADRPAAAAGSGDSAP